MNVRMDVYKHHIIGFVSGRGFPCILSGADSCYEEQILSLSGTLCANSADNKNASGTGFSRQLPSRLWQHSLSVVYMLHTNTEDAT